MSVRNVTRDTTLASNLEAATNMVSRFRGLMLRRKLPEGGGLLIRPCNSIHMFFMLFAIDAVFVDRENRVTKVARNVRPWIGLAFGGRAARAVLELPTGAAGPTEPGDMLEITL